MQPETKRAGAAGGSARPGSRNARSSTSSESRQYSGGDLARAREALQFISPSHRDTWVRMGMAIKSEFGEEGRDAWDSWSQQDETTYSAGDARDVWKSLRTAGGIGIGSLYHEAKAGGWRDDNTRQKPTADELAERRRVAAERAQREEAERARERAEAARKAAALWAAAGEADASHPYLTRKGIAPVLSMRQISAKAAAEILGYHPKSDGEHLAGELLLIPIKVAGSLSTLELIDETGRKASIAGGQRAGGFWAPQPMPDDCAELVLLIGEGVATTLSASTASGHPAVAALASGNLIAVATEMRARYPAAALVLLADLTKKGSPDPHAIDAAAAVNGSLAVPDFGPDRAEGQKDFNDLALIDPAAVAACIALDTLPNSGTSCPETPGDEPNGASVSEIAAAVRAAKDNGGKVPRFEIIEWQAGKPNGLYYFGSDTDKETGEDRAAAPLWLCSPLWITASTRDDHGEEWGRLLVWKDRDGREHRWAMPMGILAGTGEEIRAVLLSGGLELSSSPAARRRLIDYLMQTRTEITARAVTRTGWYGSAFVYPHRTEGDTEREPVIFQSTRAEGARLETAATLATWRNQVAIPSAGNSRLVLAISAGLAAPCLGFLGETEGVGFHLRGASSTGKSTALYVAASVWGSPGYVRSWRSTDNALEGVAVQHSDLLLCLDEMGELAPSVAGKAAYMLANGQGKGRANRDGSTRTPARWRVLFFSSGEIGLADLIAEDGGRSRAGQAVRVIDLPADAGAGLGLFERLPNGLTPGSFADALRDGAATNHGSAGPAFVARLVKEYSAVREELRTMRTAIAKTLAPSDAAGQVHRVAQRFALIAAAGELATDWGLTGWSNGEAGKAAAACFRAWIGARGTTGAAEPRAMLQQVRRFLEAHGESRFAPWDGFEGTPAGDKGTRVTVNRAGFRREAADGSGLEFYILPECFRSDVCQGFDPAAVARALLDIKALEPDKTGKLSRSERLPGMGTARCYRIGSEIWSADHA